MLAAMASTLIIVYGGPSAEHEVSCVSALHVARAVDPASFRVAVAGLARDRTWVDATRVFRSLGPDAERLPSPDTLEGRGDLGVLLEMAARPDTVIFPLIHGTLGEDGALQGVFETMGAAYVGASVAASAVCMEKHVTKAVLASAGVPQGDYRVVRSTDIGPRTVADLGAALGFPCFVKPSGQGSSVGVSKASSEDALAKALNLALEFGDVAVVESSIEGSEIELAVLGNLDPECTGPGEVVPSQDFYDYEDKYELGTAELHIPARLPDAVSEAARRIALRAYRALDLEGFARVDLFVTSDGQCLVNEVNTIPGFTPISMYPKLWEHEGLAYSDLIARLVGLALERAEHRAGFRRTHR
jgi:D-alanine-D-alanine ligase